MSANFSNLVRPSVILPYWSVIGAVVAPFRYSDARILQGRAQLRDGSLQKNRIESDSLGILPKLALPIAPYFAVELAAFTLIAGLL